MTFHYSLPFESLLERDPATARLTSARVVIVGSGYGGSIAALRVSNPEFARDDLNEHDVLVLERGNEYRTGEFPTALGDLPRHVRVQTSTATQANVEQHALFDVRIGRGVDVLVGSGLGGTSLINANVAIHPERNVFRGKAWPDAISSEGGLAELDSAFEQVSRWLGVTRNPALQERHKYRALARIGRALGLDVEPAPLTVTFNEGLNHAGVRQPACTGCGNCITGCNVGAKNTLAMNLIPAAAARGVTFYTGAWVASIEPASADSAVRWRVHVQPTSSLTRARHAHSYYIDAGTVILCAGALGSTEILQRSEHAGFIACSRKLGTAFSTNGDGLAASFAGSEVVHALGASDVVKPDVAGGPTITACARSTSTAGGVRYLLQDGSIPAPLIDVVGEVMTTAAQLARLGYNRLPAWLGREQADSTAVHRGALEHSQIFLLMSDDPQTGTLNFNASAASSQSGVTTPVWPAEPNQRMSMLCNELARHDRSEGLDSGQFVNNPLWQLLPPEASQVMSGSFPRGRLLTVHPLGGCPMGNSAAEGVVNDRGQVFNRDTGQLYPGLFVMDGSILPTALGVNPFLTIAALAWRACESMAGPHTTKSVRQPLPRSERPHRTPAARDAEIIVREQLVGELPEVGAAIRQQLAAKLPDSSTWFENSRLILRLATETADTEIALGRGTDRPGGTRESQVRVHAQLYRRAFTGEQMRRWKLTEQALSSRDALIASGTGTMTIMEADEPGLELLQRRDRAALAYRDRRDKSGGQLLWLGSKLYRKPLGEQRPEYALGRLRQLHAMLATAEMHAHQRRFRYDLKLSTCAQNMPLTIAGSKVIAWDSDRLPLWRALTELTTDLTLDDIHIQNVRFRVDLNAVICDGILDVAPHADTARGIMSCIAYLSRLARGILESSFWEFGAPDYPDERIATPAALPPALGGRGLVTHTLQAANESVQLHRYGAGGRKGSVLLIHGLAQGSLIYAHPQLPVSMTEYFLNQGYDVWLLDHRLSNRRDQIDTAEDAMDRIGAHDVPAAAHFIAHDRPAAPIHIFAHCVGAVGVSMAILKGRLAGLPIRSVALNAIHPWVMPSEFNAVRARLGTLFRDHVRSEWLIPIPDVHVTPFETLLDRLAFSLSAALDHGSRAHTHAPASSTAAAICDRMTLLYGRMWRHVNVRSIHRFWSDLVGPAPAAVYQHLHRLLLHGQLVDHDGCPDAYATLENFQHWRGIRTLFVHGEESEVFNAQSATRSAIRLRRALVTEGDSTPVSVHRISDYGHMDPILADDAAARCFAHISRFFAGELDDTADPNTEDDPSSFIEDKTRCGPVLRSARPDGEHIILRYWIEELADRTALPAMHEILPGNPLVITEVTPPDVEIGCRWFDATYEPSLAPLTRGHAERLLDSRRAVSFFTGSCYYPGTPFDHVAADRTFAGMNALLDAGTPCDAFFLLGDTIYADATAGLLDPQSWRDRYVARYRTALNSPAARQLISRVPTHFAIDDHEIANDFQGPVASAESGCESVHQQRQRSLRSGLLDGAHLEVAMRAARSWMGAAHSDRQVDCLWYAGDDSLLRAPFFVMDTRSERKRATTSEPPRMLSSEQLKALEQWLIDKGQVRGPKFVFMGAVIAPLTRDVHQPGMRWRDDNFVAYPDDLATLVRCIVQAKIHGLVFISGDLHLSCTAELAFHYENHEPVNAWQVVASGLYSPLAFVNTDHASIDWLETRRIELPRGAIQYCATPLTTHRSHFLRISIDESPATWTARATAFDEDGQYLAHAVHRPDGTNRL